MPTKSSKTKSKASDDKVVKEIIGRYGDTLDLRKSPYLIAEIVRQYGPRFQGGNVADCQPPGGPPDILDESILVEELARRGNELIQLSTALKKSAKKGSLKRSVPTINRRTSLVTAQSV